METLWLIFLPLILSVGHISCVYVGCFKDELNARLLPASQMTHTSTMDVGSCLQHCIEGGYEYAGVEDGDECWCGHSLGHHQEIPTSKCDMLCSGDSRYICGGYWAISVYSTDYVGCYIDHANKRVFPDKKLTSGEMTTDICVDTCKAAGYAYAGTENGAECWCGNSVQGDVKTSTSACSVTCHGEKHGMCGGVGTISVYKTASSGANPVNIGHIPANSGLHMVSGLAASRAHPGYLYAINDNAGKSKIYIIDTTDASIAGVLTVQNSHEQDWEDIAVGKCPHSSDYCILVPDSGRSHQQYTIYAVKEPSVIKTQTVPVAATYTYQWSESASEAVMVDTAGNAYLLSEDNRQPANIAMLPPDGWNSVSVNYVPDSQMHSVPSGINRPLAADISPDGKHMLIKTLYRIFYWYMPDQSPINAVQKPGIHVPYGFEPEGEAVAWKHDGSGYYTVGQGNGQVLHFYPFKDHPHGITATATTAKSTHTPFAHQTSPGPSTSFHNPATGYYNEFVEIGHIDEGGDLHLTSGLAASREHPGYLYAIKDNAGDAKIYIVDEWTAQVVATLHVQHATEIDWEDIAVGPCHYIHFCIYVADTGATDHKAQNTVYRIVEPDKIRNQNVQVEDSIHFTWSEASSEAMAVSGDNVYIMSDGSASKLAKLPNDGWGNSHNIIHLSPILTLPLPPSDLGPLAADISASGKDLLIKTVNHVYHWHMEDGNVEKALTHPGTQVSYLKEARGEAIAWNTDGTGYFTFGQGSNDILYLYRHQPDGVCNWCPKQ